MSERTLRAAVALAAVAVALTGTAVARAGGGDASVSAEEPGRLTVTGTVDGGAVEGGAVEPTVQPGGAVTGSISIANPGTTARRVSDVVFGTATSHACTRTGLALAPTLAPTPESPLVVPAGGTAVLGWTGYMDDSSDHACQGARLTSAVSLDGQVSGAVTVTAGRLAQPPAPTGGLTTSSRAAVRWAASTAADPGWVLERAVAGTDDWSAACGSSAQRPLRTLSCTDTGLTAATSYRYRVTLRTGHWHATSRPSGPVTTQDRPSA